MMQRRRRRQVPIQVQVTVTTPGGTSTTGAGSLFTYLPGKAPWTPLLGDTQPELFDLVVNPTFTSGTEEIFNVYSYKRFVRAWGSYAGDDGGGSGGTAIIQLSGTSKSWIIFDHCIFDPGAEDYENYWNIVSINTYGNTRFDHIYFIDCLFKGIFDPDTGYSLNRTGFECTSRNTETPYQDIRLIRCVVEPQGSQGASFDGPEAAANCLVQDLTILGSGNHPDSWPWGQGFEINGPTGFTVENLTIYPGRGSGTNLGGPDVSGVNCNWTFDNIDLKPNYHSLQVIQRASDEHPIYAHDMHGAVWSGQAERAVSGGSSYMTYLQNCDNNDFSEMVWGSGTRYKDANSTGNVGL